MTSLSFLLSSYIRDNLLTAYSRNTSTFSTLLLCRHGKIDDDEFDLEPCSMWTSFMNAALHFSRVTLDLTPPTQIPQVLSFTFQHNTLEGFFEGTRKEN